MDGKIMEELLQLKMRINFLEYDAFQKRSEERGAHKAEIAISKDLLKRAFQLLTEIDRDCTVSESYEYLDAVGKFLSDYSNYFRNIQ